MLYILGSGILDDEFLRSVVFEIGLILIYLLILIFEDYFSNLFK
jgi:hypothetical protein